MKEVIVIGGGLAGLTAAYLLKKRGIAVQVLEANNYTGGRIKTVVTPLGAALEMGATWVFNDRALKALIAELDIPLYEQYSKGFGVYERSAKVKPEKFDSTQMTGGQIYYKVGGGTSNLIKRLANEIGNENIELNAPVQSIEDKGDFIEIKTANANIYKAKQVIVAIPPKLLSTSVIFIPELADNSNNIRKMTHTWMGESAKFSVAYKTPFWRAKNMAGLAVSMVGLVREVQDQVNIDNTAYALVGFLNLQQAHYNMSKVERKAIVIKDLARLFGKEAENVIAYEDHIWNMQPYTSSDFNLNKGLFAHQNNGNKELTKPQMNYKLFFAGAETSATNPGYMEGAVASGIRVQEEIFHLAHE